MSKDSSNITHKELLTFTNLTNLEWEFAEIRATNEDGDVLTGENAEYKPLNELLDPELFYREDEEGEIDRYIYGGDEHGNYDAQEGLREMREAAGIAMEYKEKDTEEANFLEKWEVIYGADNYKVVKDYLDYKWANLCRGLNSLDSSLNLDEDKDIYPAREDVETAERWQARLQVAVNTADLCLSILTAPAPDEELSGVVENIGLKELTKEIAASLTQTSADNLGEDYAALAIGMALVFNIGAPAEILSNSLKGVEKQALKELTKELEANAPEEVFGKLVKFDENLDMRDTGFRVAAFRKKADDSGENDKIVVAYKGKELKEEYGFPREFELLQIVYNRLKRENPKAEIIFTGYNRGADLSFINSLFADHRLKYEVEEGDTLSEINERLSGSAYPWEGKLEKEDGTKIERETIYSGEEVYYEEEGQKPAVLFYTKLEELKKYIQFTPENIGQEYKPFRKVAVPGAEEIVGGFSSKILISILVIGAKLLKGMRLSSNAVKSILLLNFKAAVVSLCVSLITSCREYFQGYLNQEIYEEFQKLGLIEEEKDISNGVDSSDIHSSYLREKIVEEEIIKGYITDKFWLKSYIELEIPIFIEENERKKVKLRKEPAVYIIKNRLIDSGQVVFRRGENKKQDAVFLRFNVRGADWLKLVKNEAGIYEINSLIPTGDDNNPLALTYDANSYRNEIKDITEWKLVSTLELKEELEKLEKEISDLEDRNREPAQKYFKKEKIKAKKRAIEDYRKEISEAQMTAGLMEIIADMQRNWEEKKNKVEAIYWDLEAMLKRKEETIKVSDNVLKLAQSAQKENQIEPEITTNEFGFMPFIGKEGNIKKEEPKLREEYKANLFKSIILYYLEDDSFYMYRSDQDDMYNSLLYKRKFSSAELPGYHSLNAAGFVEGILGEGDVNEKFLEVLEEVEPIITIEEYRREKKELIFNHYGNLLQEVKENPEILENYYQVEKIEEHKIGDWTSGPLSNIKADLILNPMPEKEKTMEYKYNPDDYIVGGELSLTVKDVPKDIAREMAAEPDYPLTQLARASLGELNNGNLYKQIAKKTGESMEFEKEEVSVKEIVKKIEEQEEDGSEEESREPLKVAIDRVMPVDKRGRA